VIGGRGGYVSLAHIVLRFTRAAISMGGATWLNVAGICRVLAMSLISWVYSSHPMGMFLCCTYSIWMARLYVLGSIPNYGGFLALHR